VKPNKLIIAGAFIVATLTLGGCSLFYPNPTPTDTPTPTKTETPTPTPTPTVDPNLNEVKVNIINTSAFRDNGNVEIIAEALGILEDNGSCALTLSQSGSKQTVTVKAEPNVNSTQCFPMSIPVSGFKDGNVSYTVTYLSDKSTGTISGTIQIQ
jgi:hypothetical protein